MEKELEEKEIITEEDIDESDPENNKNKKYDESRIYYVYKHVRLDNNTCFYIGKGKDGRKDVPNRNPTHDSICKEHEYKVVIFKDKLNEKEAFKLEEDLIRCYVFKMGYGICIKGYMNNNNKFLTNRTFGGEGSSGYKFSEESKQKMSESHKGIQFSEEHKKNLSESLKGENHPMYGKHQSEETRRKRSESMKGKMTGENHPMWGKPSPNKGKKGLFHHSEESKQKISEKVSGEKNGMWGKPSPNKGKKGLFYHSEEEKRKISKAQSKKVICITTGKKFDSMKEAEKHYKCSGISACCRGIRKHTGELDGTPLEWKYAED